MTMPALAAPTSARRPDRPLTRTMDGSGPRCGCCRRLVIVRAVGIRRGTGPEVSVAFPCACLKTRRCYRCERCVSHCDCAPIRPALTTKEVFAK